MWHRLRGRARHAPTARDPVDERPRGMSRVFIVELDAEGLPEPMFCSVCSEWQVELVYFVSGNIEVSMCAECITYAGNVLLDVRDRLRTSRA